MLRKRLKLLVIEAAIVTGVAGVAVGIFGVADSGLTRADEVEEAVLFAVDADFDEIEEVAGGIAFDPEFIA